MTSFLLACGLVGLLGEAPGQPNGAASVGRRPAPATSGLVARTPERPKGLAVAAVNVRRPTARH